MPVVEVRAHSEDGTRMEEYFEGEDYRADLLRLRRLLSDLTTVGYGLEGGGLRHPAKAA